jgi:excisionase family DNA binding protein
LCVEEVADLLSVSRSTVYRLINRNALPFVRFGPGLLRFERAAIADWVNSCKDGVRSPECGSERTWETTTSKGAP